MEDESAEALAVEVRRLTAAMRSAAESGRWEALPSLTETRSRLLERIVEQRIDPGRLRRLMEDTLAADLRLRDLALAARREIAERLCELSRARRGSAAYLDLG